MLLLRAVSLSFLCAACQPTTPTESPAHSPPAISAGELGGAQPPHGTGLRTADLGTVDLRTSTKTPGNEALTPAAGDHKAEEYASLVAAPDRTEEDRALDLARKPAEVLAFAGIESGMRVAELAAGGGYTAELLARAVGPNGQVYAQNSPFILERFAEVPWSARLQKPVMGNVVRVDREFDDPFPADLPALDVVMMVLFYHDTVWFGTDRARMNGAIFKALKPGGAFVVIDHSARAGDGVTVAETLHRIEESVVLEEVKTAGFVVDAGADFLRNPDDTKDWNASPSAAGEQRGSSDRFIVRFRKPAN